jgi:signal transduction histidine kinase
MNQPPPAPSSEATSHPALPTTTTAVATTSATGRPEGQKWMSPITRMLPRNWRFLRRDEVLAGSLEPHVRVRTALLQGLKPDLCAEIGRRVRVEESLKRAKDDAEAANRERSEFLAQLARELRAAVLTMNGSAYVLRSAQLQPEHARVVQTLCQKSQSLLSTLNDLIELSTIESGRLSLEHVPFDLSERVRLATNLFAGEIASKGLAFSVQIDPAIPQRLRGDPLRLQQILINLLDNAVRFTERGAIGINIRLITAAATRLRLRFEITDTGIGIPASTCALLFRPFVSADQPARRPGSSIGFGLAICRQLAALMHGDIGVESTAAVGSKFWFTAEFERAGTRSATAND